MKHHHLRLFLIFSFSLLNFSLSAQSWEPVGGGLTGEGTNRKCVVYDMCVYNNKLYVAGRFTQAGKLKANHIASWNETKWDSLGSGTDNPVWSLCVYRNFLIAGGNFTIAGKKHTRSIAMWVDTINTKPGWYNLGKGIPALEAYSSLYEYPVIFGMAEYHSDLFVRGYFTEAGNVSARHIAKWNPNTGWQNPTKIKLPDDGIILGQVGEGPLYVCNNKLYLGGWKEDSHYNDQNMLCTWDDNTFKNETIKDGPSIISCMTSTDSCIYIAGTSDKQGNAVAKWDGKKWTALGNLPFWVVNSIIEYNGKLYVGGTCRSSSNKGLNCVACWDGNSWQPVGAGLSTTVKWHKAHVQSLCVYKGELYAAGYFTYSGGKTVMNIAKLKLNK